MEHLEKMTRFIKRICVRFRRVRVKAWNEKHYFTPDGWQTQEEAIDSVIEALEKL